MSTAARFVTLCVREPHAVDGQALFAAATAVRDWDAVLAMTSRHTVAAYVRQAVAREGIALPTRVDAALRQQTHHDSVYVLQLNALAKRVLAAFQRAQIPAIVLKGPALAPSIYPDPVLRPYFDLDLLVDPADEAAGAALLVGSGLTEQPYAGEAASRARATHVPELATKELSFRQGGGRLVVELHADPLQLFLKPLAEAGRWQRAVPIPGQPWARMLGAEDQLVQLTVHAHRHGFDRLIWLKDVDLLLRTHAGRFDWDLAIDVARREGLQMSGWYGLRLAQRLLRTPVPPAALARLGPPAPLRPLYDAAWPLSVGGECPVFFDSRRLRVVRRHHWGLSGPLPSLVFMGRRRDRAQALLRIVRRSPRIGPRAFQHLIPSPVPPRGLRAALGEVLAATTGRLASKVQGR